MEKEIKRIANEIGKEELTITNLDNYIMVIPDPTITNQEIANRLMKDRELDKCITCRGFHSVANHPSIELLPIEILRVIDQYVPIVHPRMVSLCRLYLYKEQEIKVQKIIDENIFDMNWYDYGSLDYRWANDTIYEAKDHLKRIQKRIAYLRT